MRIRSRLAVVAVALAAAAIPGAAHAAAPTVVTFDDLPANAAPGDFYRASLGVRFGSPALDFGLAATFPDRCGSQRPTSEPSGINGTSMAIGCYSGGELGTWTYQAAIAFDEERRGVSFDLRSATGTMGPVTVTLIRDNGTAIDSQTLSLPAGVTVPVSFTRAAPDIDDVVISADGDAYPHDGYIDLDNLTAPKDDVPPPPKFAIGLTQPSIDVPEGGTAKTQIAIRRINGSTGPITLSAGPLPADIAAIKLDPNPVTGSNPPTLSITARGPAGGDRQLSLTATGAGSAGTNVSLPVTQTAHIVPALVMPEALAERSGGVVAGCPTTYKALIGVRGGFSNPIHLYVSKDSGPVTVVNPSITVAATGDGTVAFPIQLSQPVGDPGDSYLHLTFAPEGATPQSETIRINAGASSVPKIGTPVSFGGGATGFADQWLPETTPGLRDAAGSTQIALDGTFPAGCNYAFTDDLGQNLPIVKIERGRQINQEDIDGGGNVLQLPDRVILQLPDNPRSTAIHDAANVFGASVASPRITLRTFRNSFGFNDINSGEGAGTTDFSWSDFLRTFGSDDGDLCTPFGCVRDPIALIAWHFVSNKLEGQNGICFGWSTMALRFATSIEQASSYQKGARYPYDITTPGKEGTAIKSQLIRWQAAQQDMNWSDYIDDLKDDVPSPARFHDTVKALLRKNGAVVLGLRHGDEGHAVVAYDMKDLVNGRYEIDTYNPNFPYTAGEENNAKVRDSQTMVNKIIVQPDAGWKGGGSWIGYVTDASSPWYGDMSDIEAYDHSPPENADLPINPERWLTALANWATSSGGSADASTVSQITVDGHNALKADGEAKAGTGVRDHVTPTGSGDDLSYELSKGHTYDLTVRGSHGGRYTQSVMGGGAVATVSTSRGAGETDHVTLTPGQAEVGIAGGGAASAATLDVGTHAGKASRALEATVVSGAGRSDALGFTADRSTITLAHTGTPTSVALTITSAGTGTPGSITTAPIRIGAGQKLSLKPVSWGDLSSGARYTVSAHGKVLRSGRAALRASSKVRFSGRIAARLGKAKGGKRRLVVTGRIARPSTAPLLLVRAQVVRRGKVIASVSANRRGVRKVKAGAFSLPLSLHRVPAGARVVVTATLIDEAAGLASTRSSVTAR